VSYLTLTADCAACGAKQSLRLEARGPERVPEQSGGIVELSVRALDGARAAICSECERSFRWRFHYDGDK
jgi:hypothetical protein